ncbi:MAG: dTMP kinase [Bacteriovorax sp.]|nr:dTMP kinase [Bacteriovorax sp.]
MNKKGKFIVFEGLDGSGKGTQIKKLKEYLEKKNIEVLTTCEHTRDLPVGKVIEAVLNKKEKMGNLALQLAFVSDRRDHYDKVIGLALEEGKFVISDRYYGSTVAYTEDDKKQMMLELNEEVVPVADLTIFLDVSPESAIERIDNGREDKTIFEKKKKLRQCRNSYLWFCDHVGGEVAMINGNREVETIHQDIIKILGEKKII